MPLEKKRRLKKNSSAETLPIVETVMEDVSYTATSSSIVQNELINRSGGVGGEKKVKIKKEVKPRNTSKAKSSVSSSTIASAATTTITGLPSNDVLLKHETRGRSKVTTQGIKKGDSKSTKQQKSLYYEEEAEEGEEDEEDEEDEEEEADEVDEEDEDQFNNDEGQGKEYDANHDQGVQIGVNYNDHQDHSAYALEVDHNIISNSSARPPIGSVLVSNEYYKRLAQKQTAPLSSNMYAPSFNAPS